MSSMRMNCHVFIDFDGTLAPGDPTDTLLGAFADPSWLELEAEFKAGRMTSRECMARQFGLLRVSPEAYDAKVLSQSIDPGFADFARICRRHGISMTIVSDGPDRSIKLLLDKAGIDLPYFANKLEYLGDDSWKLGFPHARGDCAMVAGNCKCQFAERDAAGTKIMIGDGRSDFCISTRVDLVLAKGVLAAHCRTRDLPHHAINDFRDATRILASWVKGGVSLNDGRYVEIGSVAA
jgi:2-hydroxy-3-keto-5-methylthiopentenyl-1-phosphate phosphatase